MNNIINTFLVGGQKCGTSSLYNWLGQHPGIEAPKEIKDYHFFSKDELFKKKYKHINSFYQNRKAYINLYASVNYLYYYDKVAERIHKYNPNSKIIICLRNPVDRAISAYKYMVTTNREKCTFNDAIERELKNKLLVTEYSDNTYIDHGKYLAQIKGFKKYFDHKQIHFIIFEELINTNKRNKVLQETLHFLEVDKLFEFNFTHVNKTGSPKFNLLTKLIREQNILKSIMSIVPFSIRKSIAKSILEWNISNKTDNFIIEETINDSLQLHFITELVQLSKITRKDLKSIWKI